MSNASLPVLIFCLIAVCRGLQGQTCRADLPDDANYKISQVQPNVRWASDLTAGIPVKSGDPYTQANVNAARDYVRLALNKQDRIAALSFDRLRFRYIEPCTIVQDPSTCERLGTDKCVILRIDVYALRVPAIDTTSLAVDRPRSPTDTDLTGVPKPLLAFSPTIGINHDSALGTGLHIATSSNLSSLLSGRQPESSSIINSPENWKAILSTDGSRALDSPYYLESAQFSIARVVNGVLKQVGGEAAFYSESAPFGAGDLRANEFSGGLVTILSSPLLPFRSTLIQAAYEHAHNVLLHGVRDSGSESQGNLRISTDGTLWSAPLRLSAWAQYSATTPGTGRKLVLRAGYDKAIQVKRHQTIGIELLGGYGFLSGVIPRYDYFVGGSGGADFLFQPFGAATDDQTPSGPVIRNYGAATLDWLPVGQQINRQTFSHVNVSMSIPVGLSHPLIPDFEPIPGFTVGDLLKARVDKDNLLKAVLKSQGHTDAEATAEQERVMRSVRPAVHFVADNANLWSIKPLLLFDFARTTAEYVGVSSFSPHETWRAIGGGVQFEVVTAQFQAAYIHSISPPLEHRGGGNFVLRLIFQNLF